MAASCTGSRVAATDSSTTLIHMAAITQIRQPDTQGRVYFDRRVAEGKTKKEALRSLKRQISQRRLPPARARRHDNGSGRTLGNDSSPA